MDKKKLENQIKLATTTRQRIDLLNDLAKELIYANKIKAFKISEQAHSLSTIEEFATNHYQRGLGYSLTNLCELNFYLGKTDLSFSQANKALVIFETLNDLDGQAAVLSFLGFSHMAKGNYPDAIDCEHLSIKYARQTGNKMIEGRSIAYLATTYGDLDNIAKMEDNYEQALTILSDINDEIGIALTKNNMANAYWRLEEYEIGLQHALQSLKLCKKLELDSLEKAVLDTIGGIYLKMEDFDQAKYYLERVISHKTKDDNQYTILIALYKLGHLHSKTKVGLAIKYLNQALTLSKKHNTKPVQILIYKLLSEIYEQQGDFKKAFNFLNQFQVVEKEVYNLEANKKIQTLESIHKAETSKKEAEIYQLKNIDLKQKMKEMSILNNDLQKALDEIKTLRGIIPICSNCKKIRDDAGYWNRIEAYIQQHSEAQFSHGVCPECAEELYGKEDWYTEIKGEKPQK